MISFRRILIICTLLGCTACSNVASSTSESTRVAGASSTGVPQSNATQQVDELPETADTPVTPTPTFEGVQIRRPTAKPSPTLAPTWTPPATPLPYTGPFVKNSDSPEVEGFPSVWIRHSTPYGGYSLEIPQEWYVYFADNGTADILPPTHIDVDRIFVQYVPFEKPAEADLVEWLESWAEVERQENPANLIGSFELVESSGANDNHSAIVYEHSATNPAGQAYVLMNEGLALRLHTNGTGPRQDAILRHVAESVKFTQDAPTTLLDLYSTDSLPYMGLTIDEFTNEQRIQEQAWTAFHERMSTGEAPTELLEDADVADEYIRILEGFQESRSKVDAAGFRPTSTPLPAQPTSTTVLPTTSATIQPQSPLEATPTSTRRPTKTPLPTSTATPTVDPMDIAAESNAVHPGLDPYANNLISSFLYWGVVWYEPNQWEERSVQGIRQLDHRVLDGCQLSISSEVIEQTQPFSAQDIAGAEWNVSWLGGNDRFAYMTNDLDAPFTVLVNLPDDEEYRETDKQRCQTDIETVLETATVVDTRE